MVKGRAGRGSELAVRVSEPAGRVSDPARSVLELAGRASELAGRASEPAGENGAFLVCGVTIRGRCLEAVRGWGAQA